MSTVTVKESPAKREAVIGIDILPGSSTQSRGGSRYAMAVLVEGVFKELKDKATLNDIIRYADRYSAGILAVDNLFEVVYGSKEVYSLLLRLPDGLKLVQVTGAPGYVMKPVYVIAKEHGVDVKGHLSPLDNAKILAVLASRGVGFEVKAFENETMIKVARGRNLGPGGSSQDRLRRRLHSFVLNTTRDIEYKLKQSGLQYELVSKESDFGLDNSKFIVSAAKRDLKGLVRPINGPDIKVTVKPIRSKNLSYIPLSGGIGRFGAAKRLIVGVDPGITTGLAIMDLNGNILDLKSTKTFSKGELIRYIHSFGSPVIYACDTLQVPDFVIKLANATQSKLFSPRRVMSISEKQELAYNFTKDLKFKVTNSHKRDALAAAIKAYQYYKPVFSKIDLKLAKAPHLIPPSEVKAEVILHGKPVSQAISNLASKGLQQDKPVPEPTKQIDAPVSQEQVLIRELKRQISSLTLFNQQLKEENNALKAKLEDMVELFKASLNQEALKQRRDRAFQMKELEISNLKAQSAKLNNMVSTLQSEISKLKNIKTLEAQGKVQPVKIVHTFSKEGLAELEEKYGILEGDILFFEDAGGGGKATAEILVGKNVKAVITKNEMSHLAMDTLIAAEVPIIPVEAVDLTRYSEFCAVDKEKFSRVYYSFVADIRRRKDTMTAEKIKEIISEYKSRRVEEALHQQDI